MEKVMESHGRTLPGRQMGLSIFLSLPSPFSVEWRADSSTLVLFLSATLKLAFTGCQMWLTALKINIPTGPLLYSV